MKDVRTITNMPAAKYTSLGVSDEYEPNKRYVNVDYFETNYRHDMRNKTEEWRKGYDDIAYAGRDRLVSLHASRGLQVQSDSEGDYENANRVIPRDNHLRPTIPDVSATKFPRDVYDDAQFSLRRDADIFSCHPSLNFQAVWRKTLSKEEIAVKGYNGQSQENYLSHPPSTPDCPPQACCNSMHSTEVFRSTSGYFSTQPSSGEPSLHYSRSAATSDQRVCTLQPTSIMKEVNPVELTVQRFPQVDTQPLHLQNGGYVKLPTNQTAGVQTTNSSNPLTRDIDEHKLGANNTVKVSVASVEQMTDSQSTGSYNVMNPVHRSSVTKLGEQIRNLREEMFSLRSTTVSFKEHMEKMFDDMKLINRINNSHVKPSRRINPDQENETTHYFSKQEKFRMERESPLDKGLPAYAQNRTRSSHIRDQQAKHSADDLNSQQDLFHFPKYENVGESFYATRLQTENFPKRTKSGERPNSDPFTSCLKTDSNVFSHTGEQRLSTASLPNSQSTNKNAINPQNSGPELECGKAHDILPALQKSNAVLHVSGCSIDSGYQGSAITSPRYKQELDPKITGLRLRSVESSEAGKDSPCGQSYKTPGGLGLSREVQQCPNNRLLSETVLLQSDNVPLNANSSRSASIDSLNCFSTHVGENSKHLNYASSIVPAVLSELKSPEESNHFVTTTKVEKKSASHLRTPKNSVDDTTDPPHITRPIPKQRTVFSPATSENSRRSEGDPDIIVTNINEETIPKILYDEDFSFSDKSLGEVKLGRKHEKLLSTIDTGLNQINDAKQLFSKQSPAALKQATSNQVKSDSPSSNRVKLGVSAISHQSNPIAVQNNYTVAMKDRGRFNNNPPRTRKNASAKQILREKFAAVVEKSVAAKRKVEGEPSDGESSIVRRRSMRMMQEFQIFDFKDCNLNSSSMKIVQANHLQSPAAPDSNYSPSPSAASLSKQIFETDIGATINVKKSDNKNVVERSMISTDNRSNLDNESRSCKTNQYEKLQISLHSSKPLPSPSLTSSSSPPSVRNVPPSLYGSRDSMFSEAELIPQRSAQQFLFHSSAPVIKPKATLPGVPSDAIQPVMLKTSLNDLNQLPSARKSAFTPVLSSSLKRVLHKDSALNEDCRLYQTNDGEVFCRPEYKRRTSLPLMSVSNKQKYFNDMSLAPNNKPAECTKAQVSEKYSSNNISGFSYSQLNELSSSSIQDFTSSKQLYGLQENENQLEYMQDQQVNRFDATSKQWLERRRHASADKERVFHLSVDHQSVKHKNSEKISNVMIASQATVQLCKGNMQRSTHQVSGTCSSLKRGRIQIQDNKCRETADKTRNGISTTAAYSNKTKSSKDDHKYEIVEEFKTERSTKGFHSYDGTNEPLSPTRHKSAVALLKASFMGKRDRLARSVSNDGKRVDLGKEGEQKIRSLSADYRKDIKILKCDDPNKKLKNSKKKNQLDSKTTKEKSSTKHTKDNSSKLSSLKTIHEQTMKPLLTQTSCHFSDSYPMGNPHAELMERFPSTASSSQNFVRSPLQRLRCSLRNPRNKIKPPTRSSDDMDVFIERPCSISSVRSTKTLPLRQDQFTYV